MAGVTPVSDHLSVLLSCYLDGELTPGELDEVVYALEHDLDAIAAFRSLQSARREVRLLPTLSPPLYLIPGGHLGEELSAYLDGELTTIEMPLVSAHLEECSDCRMELGDLDRSRIAVRALPGIEPPEFLDVKRAEKERRRRAVWPAAVAGGVAAIALAFTVTSTGGGTEPTAIDLADLQTRHAAVASVPSGASGLEISSP
ncbi:MAG: anti-sigma factor family protein [Acidimicrobiia bacterium]